MPWPHPFRGLAPPHHVPTLSSNFFITNTHLEINLNPEQAMNTIDPSENPKVEHRIREFLKALNSAGGKPIEP